MTPTRVRGALALLLPLALLVAPRFVIPGGVIQAEARLFLVHYTSDRPLLARLFDPRVTELGDFRGRELSCLVDLLDARWVDATIRLGCPTFVPLSWLAGMTFLASIFLVRTRRLFPRTGLVGSSLLLALFLSDPVVFLTARFYLKSAKLPVACLLLPFAFFVRERLGTASPRGTHEKLRLAGLAGAWCLALSLLDEQGAALGAAVGLLALVAAVVARRADPGAVPRAAALLAGCVAGVALARAHVLVVSPAIVHAENGYWPSFGYLRFDDASRPGLEDLVKAASFLGDQALFFLGNASLWLSLALLVMGTLVVAAVRPDGSRRGLDSAVLAVVGGLALLLVAMFAVMIGRHPPVAQPDIRRGYYGLPALTLALFASALALDRVVGWIGRARRPLVNVALVALVLGNVLSLPDHARIQVSNHLRSATEESPELLAILRERRWQPTYPRFDRNTNVLLWRYAEILGPAEPGGR